jgi:hypothetical protein
MTEPTGVDGPSRPSSRRYRDRHGRGLRGPLAPPSVPLTTSRSDRFDQLVVGAVERVRRRLPELLAALGDLEVVVADLPTPAPDGTAAGRPVALGAAQPASRDQPARLVVHRRPVEARVHGRHELEQLVRDVVTEQLAGLLGIPPEEIDPGWAAR